MSAHIRSTKTIVAALAAILSLLITAAPMGATGGGGPAYRADIAPGSAAAGTTSTLVLTIKQVSSSSSQKVRSARVSAPDGITIANATVKKGNTTLNNVSPTTGSVTVNSIPSLNTNQTVTVSLDVSIPCGEYKDKVWVVVAKNGVDFATGGSALAQAGDSQLTTSLKKCSLAWEVQPKSAQKGAVITGVEADPSKEHVKVRLLNGNGGEAHQSGITIDIGIVSGTGASGAILGGVTSDGTNANGVAEFEPTINKSERGYELEASASGIIGSGSSKAFDINDVAKVCSGACSGSSDKGSTTATINASSNGGVLTMSLGLDQLDCDNAANHFYQSISSPLTWDITPANGRTEITIRLAAADVTRSYNLYDVCFSSPVSSFRNRYNEKIAAGEAGLLKICPARLDKQDSDPCVVDKWRENGDVLIKFSVPAGDPRGRI